MKNTMLIVSLVAILVGCDSAGPDNQTNQAQAQAQIFVDSRIRFVKIDNCEYIVTGFSPLTIVHKGNCTNAVHNKH